MTAILLALGSRVGYGVSDFLASHVAKRVPPVLPVLDSPALQSVVLLVVVVVVVNQPYSAAGLAWGTAAGAVGAAGLFGLFFVLVDLGGVAAGGGVLWVALGVQLGALPTTLAGALGSRGRRRLGVDDKALLGPVAALAVLGTLVVSAAQAAG
jgi:hypothetical protein